MELTKPSGLVSQSVRPYVRPPLVSTPTTQWCRHLPLRCRHPHWVSTPSLCRCRHQCQHQHFSGISVLSTYSYHPFISTTIYPKILSNLLNLSCYMELLNLSGFILFSISSTSPPPLTGPLEPEIMIENSLKDTTCVAEASLIMP